MKIRALPGVVYLVGAGPGDPGLITMRGLALVRQAETLVYDRLVHPDLVAEARHATQCIYAGKAAGRHALPQDEINRLLVAEARAGRRVVRLKGGDPFVFGRGGEEAEALAEAGLPFEVVPGISSAVAVPAAAHIPVTHRGTAQAFSVVTGHTCSGDPACAAAWAPLAQAGTLVILMGLARLDTLTAGLIAGGCAPEMPAAAIQAGTTEAQRVVVGTLATLAAEAAGLRSPVTIVVGEAVRVRERLLAAPVLAALAA